MTKDRDFKRRIRERMEKTGESYTAARARLLSKAGDPATEAPPPTDLPDDYTTLTGKSDEAVAAKTGRTWPEWVAWLDERNAVALPHPEIVGLLEDAIDSGWWRQTVTVGYERLRGLREPGQRRDGRYEANRSRTLPLSAEELYPWLADEDRRRQWLADPHEVRGTNPPRSVRLDWPDGTRVQLYVDGKGESKAQLSVQHTHLPDRAALEARKAYWGEQLDGLKALLQG